MWEKLKTFLKGKPIWFRVVISLLVAIAAATTLFTTTSCGAGVLVFRNSAESNVKVNQSQDSTIINVNFGKPFKN